MFYNHLSCVMTKGGALPASVKNHLVLVASKMTHKGQTKAKIRSGSAQGTISTDFKHRSMGTLVGLEFSSVLETEAGTTEFVFLLTRLMNEKDMEDAVWVDPLSLFILEMMSAGSGGHQPTVN